MLNTSQLRFFLRNAHYLNLDIVAGAVLCHLVAQKLPSGHGQINIPQTIILGLSVFMAYTADRLLDIKKIDYCPTPRHEFIKNRAEILKKVLLICVVICVVLCFWLSKNILIFGFITLAVSALYFVAVFKSSKSSIIQVFKEPITALVYSAGVWGSTLIDSGRAIGPLDYAFCISFSLITFQNLLLFSWMEAFVADQAYSLPIVFGEKTTRKIIMFIFVFVLIFNFSIVFLCEFAYQRRTLFFEILMALGLFSISQNTTFFLKNERYRWVGDSVFWLMIVMI